MGRAEALRFLEELMKELQKPDSQMTFVRAKNVKNLHMENNYAEGGNVTMLDAEDVGNITAVGNVLKSDSNKKIELLIELGKLQMAVENTESESRVKGICNAITSKFA